MLLDELMDWLGWRVAEYTSFHIPLFCLHFPPAFSHAILFIVRILHVLRSLPQEEVVRLLKRRAQRVFQTGMAASAPSAAAVASQRGAAGRSGAPATPRTSICRGALFPLTLAQAEAQAAGACPRCMLRQPPRPQATMSATAQQRSNTRKPHARRGSGSGRRGHAGNSWSTHTVHTAGGGDQCGQKHASISTTATLQDVEWAASLVRTPFQCCEIPDGLAHKYRNVLMRVACFDLLHP